MSSDLMDISNYSVFVFSSTSTALKAEKVMNQLEKQFIIIPTPREISASCGLTMKVNPSFTDECCRILQEKNVSFAGAYRIEEQGKKKILSKIECEQV